MKNKKLTKVAYVFDLFIPCTEKEYKQGHIPFDGRQIYETLEEAEESIK